MELGRVLGPKVLGDEVDKGLTEKAFDLPTKELPESRIGVQHAALVFHDEDGVHQRIDHARGERCDRLRHLLLSLQLCPVTAAPGHAVANDRMDVTSVGPIG
jgi:hypothetical protein